MPLTSTEQIVRIPRFGGQKGRTPVATLHPGDASLSDGAFHNADFLAPARGASKLTSSPIPGSGYELRGLATGILEIPAVEGYDAAWISAPGSQRSWWIRFSIRPLRTGDFPAVASGDGQVFFSTGTQIGTSPSGGADINSIRASFVIASGAYKIRVRWGTSSFDVPLTGQLGTVFDPSLWLSVVVSCINGNPTATLHLDASQVSAAGVYDRLSSPLTQSVAQGWLVHQFWIGGSLPDRRPIQGVYSPCPCIVSDVALSVSTTDNGAIIDSVQAVPWTRKTAANLVTTATRLVDYWPLSDDSVTPMSLGGRQARIVGNRVTRASGISASHGGSIYCDGSGMVTIQDAEIFRESPKTRSQGGVEGHYLSRPELTFGLLLDPRRIPWRHPSVERACFFCFSTPAAANLGVSTDPLIGFYGTFARPSEHLRGEIQRSGSNWYLVVYFGELEPESLKHPGGTVGGSTSTAWPPQLSSAGEPPATWNKPQGNPASGFGGANGKTAFRILLGTDGDTIHPMAYSWWVFMQRKFVAQSDSGNACSVFVQRVKQDGTLDTVFGEVKDTNADGSGERHPANQSCFSTERLNGTDICFRPDSYLLTLGGAGGSSFGEEKNSYDGNVTRHPIVYAVDDALSRVQYSDEGDVFPYIGRIASFCAFKRYLQAKDRLVITTRGAFDSEMRLQFADDYLASYNFEEPGGNILRDGHGNDIAYVEKIGLGATVNDLTTERPQTVGAYPRPEPISHNEVDLFAGEYSGITGVAQRLDAEGAEEIYATAQPGIYLYDRASHKLNRFATLPGQGGPNQASIVVDTNDVIHVAGGAGRPVILTRDRVLAVSGLEPPFYSAPSSLVTSSKTIVGGLTLTFQVNRNTNINSLIGYEIDNTATMQFAVGYWSDVLKTRSRTGPVISVRYVDTQVQVPSLNGLATIIKYRVLVSGLPPPSGPNASLITHWEIFRTDSNGSVLLLERRIPISSQPVSVMVGDLPPGTGEPLDPFRDIPPEGMKAIVPFGDRLVGISPPEFIRNVVWSKRGDSMNWPPLYAASLNQTSAPASGIIVRKGRAFPFSRDHLYQLIETGLDADPLAGQIESMTLDTLSDGVGCISHFAATTDNDNGVYLPGNKTVYLTEGGTYSSLSLENDSSGSIAELEFSWPDSWDISQPERFVSFHDEKRRMVAICGPSSDDPECVDAMLIFYEAAANESSWGSVYRHQIKPPEMSRIRGFDISCSGKIFDLTTGEREVWFGTKFGYLTRFSGVGSMNVDYDWLPSISPKYGYVLDTPTTTVLRIEGSFSAYPSADLFRGGIVRVYRDGNVISSQHATAVTVSPSWVDVTFENPHGAIPGDEWNAGLLPLDYRSGKMDGGDTITELRLQQAQLTMNE